MDYIKIYIKINSVEDWFTDVLATWLAEIGFESFVTVEDGIEAYIPENQFDKVLLTEKLNKNQFNIKVSWEKELIKDRNWNEVWEKNYFKPLVIKDQCVIRAPFHTDFPNCKYEIIIEPNMAFGTGNHETTSMMIEFLMEQNLKGKNVLDMGCGTGILSIMASKLGAEKITAIDIDARSFEAVKSNAELNNINNIEAFLGDASLLIIQQFDLILANIQRNVLLTDMEKYCSVLNPGGKLIMSGFYIQDNPSIKEKAESIGLTDAGYTEKNKWVAYTFLK
ncbi:MAG: 50S ribosomal protein L11 methyltransferase [Prolixibacteraceae bacterium]|nr:50S ribosomal protein L11 methyltransferase [Prolixibacteraceae bacterium]MBN2775109.1 50S ribosomal protein L11 methyltransferase [Prolixibacteraceae bacterium]